MANVTYTGAGGTMGGAAWVRVKKKVSVPTIHPQFRAPLIHFFFPEEKFSDLDLEGRSGGGAQAATPPVPLSRGPGAFSCLSAHAQQRPADGDTAQTVLQKTAGLATGSAPRAPYL